VTLSFGQMLFYGTILLSGIMLFIWKKLARDHNLGIIFTGDYPDSLPLGL
jgi:hypothetical protein